ncbi:MAG: hypothetical protein GX050_04195 [Firmicutes bacterium]|nr:hypothetical protein [Bacillota bacterium]
MKFVLRNSILRLTSCLEILISILLFAGVGIASFGLLKSLLGLTGNFGDSNYFSNFLSYAMVLIIAIELIKMVASESLGSAIDVLLFAIARKLIISEENPLGFLIGVLAIGCLFIIRKYLLATHFSTGTGVLLNASLSPAEASEIIGRQLPEVAQTLGGLVTYIAQQEKRSLREGEIYELDGCKLRINRMQNGIIESLEYLSSDK